MSNTVAWACTLVIVKLLLKISSSPSFEKLMGEDFATFFRFSLSHSGWVQDFLLRLHKDFPMSLYSYSTRPYDPDKFFGWAAHQWTEEEISKVYGTPNRLNFWHPYVKKWLFHIGIHRGTMISRDSERPKEMESLEECRQEANSAKKQYASLGCKIWYCYAVGPDSKRVQLLNPEEYSR